MDKQTARKLVSINRNFYSEFAREFTESRERPQPGFYQLLEWLRDEDGDLLDVGCGSGRFGIFLRENRPRLSYYGVDFNHELLTIAIQQVKGSYVLRDISQEGSLKKLGNFKYIVCLAALQHIPTDEKRLSLLQEMRSHLADDGLMFVSTWQFLSSERQQRKILPWSLVGIADSEVDPEDHLLSWTRGGSGCRYVAYLNEQKVNHYAKLVGLKVVHQFLADGRSRNLNLYTILRGDS